MPRSRRIWPRLVGKRRFRGIKIENKDEIRKRLGRSPDDGDAIVMCLSEGARAAARLWREQNRPPRPERANVGHSELKKMLWGWTSTM
jgi:hypothetical protein